MAGTSICLFIQILANLKLFSRFNCLFFYYKKIIIFFTKLERCRDGIKSRETRGCDYNDKTTMDHKRQNIASFP